MFNRKILNIIFFLTIVASLILSGSVQVQAQSSASVQAGNAQKDKDKKDKKITHDDREAAAARALQQGAPNPLMVDAQAAAEAVLIDGAPHYFSHPNYANSPLPTVNGTLTYFGNALQDRAYASDYPVGVGELAPVLVVLPTALPDGFLQEFQLWNQANQGASPFPSAGNLFHAYVLRPTVNPNEYTVVFDSSLLTVPGLTDLAVSEVASFPVANLAVQAGDLLALQRIHLR